MGDQFPSNEFMVAYVRLYAYTQVDDGPGGSNPSFSLHIIFCANKWPLAWKLL